MTFTIERLDHVQVVSTFASTETSPRRAKHTPRS
jgi:hypothetical protein